MRRISDRPSKISARLAKIPIRLGLVGLTPGASEYRTNAVWLSHYSKYL